MSYTSPNLNFLKNKPGTDSSVIANEFKKISTEIGLLTVDGLVTDTVLALEDIKITGSQDTEDNFTVNSTDNVIESTLNTCLISGGGRSAFPNKIGSPTKPAGADWTPTDWTDDTGYLAGSAHVATVCGGYDHIVNQIAGTICGGGHNFLKYNGEGHGFIGGGSYNINSGGRSAIVAGRRNSISGASSVYNIIGAGDDNEIVGQYSSILGGLSNSITGDGNSVVGGKLNTLVCLAAIVGGYSNTVSGNYSVVAGYTNVAEGPYSAVFGGLNSITGTGAGNNILGGTNHVIVGQYSSVIGGTSCRCTGNYALAFGRKALANANGAVAFSDSVDATFENTTENSLASRYAGGYWFTGGNVGIGGLAIPTQKLAVSTAETGAVSVLKLSNSGSNNTECGLEVHATQPAGTGALRAGRIYGKFNGPSYADARISIQTMNTGDALVDTLSLIGGRVGIGNTSPGITAALDVVSTTKGFLSPRMTTTQRDAITAPAEGLQIYNLTTHKLNFYNGTAWETVTSSIV